MRLVKGGPLVAASIARDNGLWSASIDGEPCGRPHSDPVHAGGVLSIWHSAEPCDSETHQLRLAVRAWALEHDPTHPAARPREPMDLNSRAPLF